MLLLFWHATWLWPLKVLVVLFHELGHAVAAWLTGGQVLAIGLGPDQGGHTITRGGNAFLILNAGYLGSLVAGIVLLAASRNARRARATGWLLASVLLGVTLGFVRPLLGFGFGFSLLAAITLALVARWAGDEANRWALRGLGVFSVLYALFDVRDDVFLSGPDAVTDATMLAELTHVPAIVWGGGWFAAGVGLLVVTRRWLV